MKDFYVSKSHEDNVAIALDILPEVVGLNRNRSVLIGLSGELGSGKTTWTKGIVDALGGDPDQVQSPTFLIMRSHDLGENLYQFKALHHLDMYRLKKGDEVEVLRLEKEWQNPNAIFVIEWWQQVKTHLPKPSVALEFDTINDFTKTISVTKP